MTFGDVIKFIEECEDLDLLADIGFQVEAREAELEDEDCELNDDDWDDEDDEDIPY